MNKPRRSKDSIIESAIKRGKTNAEALDAVRKVYPGTGITLSTINYMRNNLRRTDSKVKPDSALRRGRS